jgi:hypothetical protein
MLGTNEWRLCGLVCQCPSLQANERTRAQQLLLWRNLVLNWVKVQGAASVKLDSFELFENKRIHSTCSQLVFPAPFVHRLINVSSAVTRNTLKCCRMLARYCALGCSVSGICALGYLFTKWRELLHCGIVGWIVGKLDRDGVAAVAASLVESGHAQWEDNEHNRVRITWRTPNEWGALIYKWVSSQVACASGFCCACLFVCICATAYAFTQWRVSRTDKSHRCPNFQPPTPTQRLHCVCASGTRERCQ